MERRNDQEMREERKDGREFIDEKRKGKMEEKKLEKEL